MKRLTSTAILLLNFAFFSFSQSFNTDIYQIRKAFSIGQGYRIIERDVAFEIDGFSVKPSRFYSAKIVDGSLEKDLFSKKGYVQIDKANSQYFNRPITIYILMEEIEGIINLLSIKKNISPSIEYIFKIYDGSEFIYRNNQIIIKYGLPNTTMESFEFNIYSTDQFKEILNKCLVILKE